MHQPRLVPRVPYGNQPSTGWVFNWVHLRDHTQELVRRASVVRASLPVAG